MPSPRLLATGAVLAPFLALFAAGVPALAQSNAGSPNLVQQYSDWELYTHEGEGGKVCFILSKPTDLRPDDRDHGDVFFFVTARPADDVPGEPSILVGYEFMEGTDVIADVDGQRFVMFIDGNGAWVKEAGDEARLVAAMRSGRTLTVSGQSSRGTDTRYTFSLSGVTASTNRMREVCG